MRKQDEKFLATEKLWYDKLKEQGFKDIEDQWGHLKEWDSNFFRNQFSETKYQTTLIYYEQARALLLTYSFKNEDHKSIWSLHCEGLTERQISLKLKCYKKSMVHYVISMVAKTIKV